MKALLICPEFPPSVGGVGRSAERLAGILMELGHEVCVFAVAYGERDTELEVQEHLLPVGKLNVYRAVCKNRLDALSYAGYDSLRVYELVRRVQLREQCDVFHLLYLERAAFASALMAMESHVPYIASARGSDVNLGAFDEASRERLSFIFGNCALATFVTNRMYERCALLFEGLTEKSHVILNSFWPLAYESPGNSPIRGRSAQLAFGVIVTDEVKKGVDVLLQALPDRSDYRLEVLAAEGGRGMHLPASLRADVSCIPARDVLNWFRGIDCYVQTSAAEGCPNAFIEAVMSGVPAICTRAGIAGEFIRDGVTGSLVDPFDSNGLRAALVEFLDSPEPHGKRALEARAEAQMWFNRDAEKARWEEVYAAIRFSIGIPSCIQSDVSSRAIRQLEDRRSSSPRPSSNRIHVCLILQERFHDTTGLTRSVSRIVDLLSGTGIRFTVVSLMLDPPMDLVSPPEALAETTFHGAKAYAIEAYCGPEEAHAARARAAGLLDQLVARLDIDMFHLFYLGPSAIVALRVAQNRGVPVVASARGSDVERGHLFADGAARLGILTRQSNVVTTVTQRSADIIRHENGVDPIVIYNSASSQIPMRPASRPTSNRLRILADGSDFHKKGIPILSRALDLVSSVDSIAHVLGSPPNLAIECSPKLDWLGVLPHRQVIERLREAPIFVQASPNEGCPNMLIEAISAGCPIIASRAGAAPELLVDGESALFFDPWSSEQLADCLERLALNPDLQLSLPAQAQQLLQTSLAPDAERRSWEQCYANALTFRRKHSEFVR